MQDIIQLNLCTSQWDIALERKFIINFQIHNTIWCHQAAKTIEKCEKAQEMSTASNYNFKIFECRLILGTI